MTRAKNTSPVHDPAIDCLRGQPQVGDSTASTYSNEITAGRFMAMARWCNEAANETERSRATPAIWPADRRAAAKRS
jgi:hypothetical protein